MMHGDGIRGDLVIAAPAGLGRIGGLYRELGALGWRVDLHEVEDPPALEWGGRLAGRWPPAAGGHSARRAWDRVQRSPWAFERRSRATERAIAPAARGAACVLQVGGMSSPARAARGPYTLFLDCTVKLGEGLPYGGTDFASPRAAERWYARERGLYQGAGAIFTASEWVRRSLIADYGVPPDRAVAVGEGCNLPAPGLERESGGNTVSSNTVLYVGYEFERKGGAVLLDAFRRVRAAVPGAELLIAGPRRIAGELPPGARLLGPVPRDELARLYSRASVFVLPSLFEPFGLVLLEAMEHAVPCVASDLCAIPEIVVDGETGLLVPAAHPPALAERIVRLLRDPGLARRMGESGRRRVRERFTWPAVARRVDRRLAALCDRSSGLAAGLAAGVAAEWEPRFQEREPRLHTQPSRPAARSGASAARA